jgi:large subunit ribosomal protein L15
MPHRLRKSRKNRGSRTCGYGRVGQHRDQGSKPERKAGRHKHKWSYVQRYEPNYFGKKGFTCPKSLHQNIHVVNVGKLEQMAEGLTAENGKYFIDLETLGYEKLLGTGKVTKPLVIKAILCSKSASQKIKDAGGEVLAETEEKGE